jgi:hypothetical protein
MAKKCYKITYTNCSGQSGVGYQCSESITIQPGGYCNGIYFVSADLGYNSSNASEISGSLAIVAMSNCPGCVPADNGDKPCDCINGGCINASTYNTPGKYANLSACQSGCAKDSNCIGECVSQPELAALQQAANNLQSKICG